MRINKKNMIKCIKLIKEYECTNNINIYFKITRFFEKMKKDKKLIHKFFVYDLSQDDIAILDNYYRRCI